MKTLEAASALSSAFSQRLRQPIDAAIPSFVVVIARFLGREQFVRHHDIRRVPPVAKLYGDTCFSKFGLRLPAPRVHELFWGANLAVRSCKVEDLPIRELPHPQAVMSAHPQVHLGARGLIAYGPKPSLQCFRVGPHPKDFFAGGREGARQMERGCWARIRLGNRDSSSVFAPEVPRTFVLSPSGGEEI